MSELPGEHEEMSSGAEQLMQPLEGFVPGEWVLLGVWDTAAPCLGEETARLCSASHFRHDGGRGAAQARCGRR